MKFNDMNDTDRSAEYRDDEPDLCEADKLYDFSRLTRWMVLDKFFTEMEDSNTDPSYLAEREHELGVTKSEWAEYHASKKRAEAARYQASPFISVLGDRDIMEHGV